MSLSAGLLDLPHRCEHILIISADYDNVVGIMGDAAGQCAAQDEIGFVLRARG